MEIPAGAVAGGVGAAREIHLGMDPAPGDSQRPRGTGDIPGTPPPRVPPVLPTHPGCLPAVLHSGDSMGRFIPL